MQSHSRCPKGLKAYLLTQTLVRLYPVAVKESPRIISTRPKTAGKTSCSDKEFLLRNWIKLEEIWQWEKKKCIYKTQSLCVTISENEQRGSIYRYSTTRYKQPPYKSSACSAWLQLMCNNSAHSQIRFLSSQETLQIKTVKDFERVRQSSRIF